MVIFAQVKKEAAPRYRDPGISLMSGAETLASLNCPGGQF